MIVKSAGIRWGAVPALELDAYSHDLDASGAIRAVQVWKVPESLAADRYFTSVVEIGQPPQIPPCLSRNAVLLLDVTIPPAGRATIRYAHPAVKAA